MLYSYKAKTAGLPLQLSLANHNTQTIISSTHLGSLVPRLGSFTKPKHILAVEYIWVKSIGYLFQYTHSPSIFLAICTSCLVICVASSVPPSSKDELSDPIASSLFCSCLIARWCLRTESVIKTPSSSVEEPHR